MNQPLPQARHLPTGFADVLPVAVRVLRRPLPAPPVVPIAADRLRSLAGNGLAIAVPVGMPLRVASCRPAGRAGPKRPGANGPVRGIAFLALTGLAGARGGRRATLAPTRL